MRWEGGCFGFYFKILRFVRGVSEEFRRLVGNFELGCRFGVAWWEEGNI